MKINEMSNNVGAFHSRKRVGRGIGSGKGKTSGKGHKGQNSRSGVSLVGFEGGQMPLYRRLPKRGFTNIFRKQYSEINLRRIQLAVTAKKINVSNPITQEVLYKAGLIRLKKDGVKLLANGEISAKLDIEVSKASKNAISAVEKSGGTVTLPEKKAVKEGKGKSRDRKGREKKAAIALKLKEFEK